MEFQLWFAQVTLSDPISETTTKQTQPQAVGWLCRTLATPKSPILTTSSFVRNTLCGLMSATYTG